jgi:hypothetical protein
MGGVSNCRGPGHGNVKWPSRRTPIEEDGRHGNPLTMTKCGRRVAGSLISMTHLKIVVCGCACLPGAVTRAIAAQSPARSPIRRVRRSECCGRNPKRESRARSISLGEFVEWTPDDHLRHSRFVGVREDKGPKISSGSPAGNSTAGAHPVASENRNFCRGRIAGPRGFNFGPLGHPRPHRRMTSSMEPSAAS